jgi:hypothetical protein
MIFLLLACAGLFTTEDSSDLETWSGYTYQQTLEKDNGLTLMSEGSLALEDIHGEEITVATQPYSDAPYYWEFELEPEWLSQESQIRIQGNPETTLPMLWKSKMPSTTGSWLSGALYTQEISFTESYFSTFLPEDLSIDLTDNSLAHLWGQPLIPGDWADVSIRVFNGDNEEVDVYSYHLLENGAISDNTSTGVTWFFAWNIPTGVIRLEVETIEGNLIQTSYYSQGGEILSAHFYALPLTNGENR